LKLRDYWLFLALCGPLTGQSFDPKPVKALGAPRLIATQLNPLAVDTANPNWVEGRELYNPAGVAIDNSTSTPAIYVVDTRNNRIMGWRSTQATPGAQADVILGQANQYQTYVGGPGTSSSLGLNAPTGIAVDGAGNVYVADSNNNRILRFPTPLATALTQTSPIQPDLVIGQPGFSTNGANQGGISASSLNLSSTSAVPLLAGLTFDSVGSLYVSDVNNNRVLVFLASALKTQNNGPAATLVLGQVSYTSATPAVNALSATGFTTPCGLTIDLKGRLYVADGLGRALVFLPPFVQGSSAARLVGIQTSIQGQPPPPPISNTTVGFPQGVAIAGSRLVVVDAADSRALVFDPYENWPDPSMIISPAAYEIIGQSGYGDHSPNRGTFLPAPATLNVPIGVATSSTELFIADGSNNRITVYPIQSGLPATSATRAIGQGFTSVNAPNLIEGREFNLFNGGARATGAIVIDRTATPPHLYVSDPGNNRILCFKDASHANPGDFADVIIGQLNGLTSTGNYPTGDPAKPAANNVFSPSGMALDSSGNLWVADTGNGRVLRFPAPFAQTGTGMLAANLVIGQSSFTSKLTDATTTTMHSPTSLAFMTDGSLLVSDIAHNRVLYFQQPLAAGMAATKVIGQTDFFSSSPNGTPADPARFSSPRGIATDAQNRLYVCDSGSARVAIFSSPAFLQTTGAQPVFSLTAGLNQPVNITIGPSNVQQPGELWVFFTGANLLIHFPSFATLSQNSRPDGSVPVNTPISSAYDAFGNIVAADGSSRVLFYVPLISVVNGANYLTRAVAPGSIVSIFPASQAATNMFGSQTVNFNSLPNPIPLPTTLGDIQVLVNLQPAPLFYVSPTQINLPLPSNLPSSGTVDIRVVSKSTGQIYGDADLTLTPVSPGLFTLTSSGFGQLAALNEDNTVNGPGNPLTRGHVLQMFGTGQGAVMGGPPDGNVSTGLAPTVVTPQVQISTILVPPENVLYSGLAPGLIGVWQINVVVPTTVTAGGSIPVMVSMSSVPSNDPSSNLRTTIALQ
jgi:uncharacterized protein (TIGR03437 family)